MNNYLIFMFKSYDRKKISSAVNILEEWLKNFKIGSIEEDKDDEEEKKT